MTTVDLLASAAIQLTTVIAAVWGLTELFGRKRKLLVSFVLGPLFAVISYKLGFFPLINELALPEGKTRLLAAAFAGFVCTITAKLIHDNVINPVLKRRKDGDPPYPPSS